MNLYTKWKQIYSYRKQTYGYQRGEGQREEKFRRMGLTDRKYYT